MRERPGESLENMDAFDSDYVSNSQPQMERQIARFLVETIAIRFIRS
jgi:hypothetical protein